MLWMVRKVVGVKSEAARPLCLAPERLEHEHLGKCACERSPHSLSVHTHAPAWPGLPLGNVFPHLRKKGPASTAERVMRTE